MNSWKDKPMKAEGVQGALGMAGLLLFCILLAMTWSPAPAAAHDNIICVGPEGDYQTIQEAMNAALDGDTIRLASDTFEENVVITKSVTIIGKWLPDCSEPGGNGSGIVPATGRAITIDPGDRTDVAVVIDSVGARGNATGLGGAEPIDVARLTATQASLAMPALAAEAQSPGRQPPADWREQLVQLATAGALPGATPDEIRARIAALDNVQLTAPAPVTRVGGTPTAAAAEVDCGGALYAKGASVHLRDFGSSWSVASSTGDGYGGAVCIIDPPVNGAVIEGGQINGNKASTAGVGIGGAVFIRGGAAGSTRINDVGFFDNIASRTATGWGGAVAVIDTPQPVLTGEEDCVFGFNVASRAANGLGGGALLLNAAQAVVEHCNFYTNYASGGGAGSTETIDASFGHGGGLYVANSDQSRLTSNIFSFNVAQTTAPKLNQGAYGGGAFVLDSNHVTVADNQFEHNIAGFSDIGCGGGLAVIGYTRMVQVDVNGNKFTDNWAAVIDYIGSAGGGLFAYQVRDSTFTTNTFTANLVAALGSSGIRLPDSPFPMGGGMTLDEPGNVMVADNVFEENVGSAGGFALGGGLGLRVAHTVTVERNTFRQNVAGSQKTGDGLGGAMAVHVGGEIIVQHNDFVENSGYNVATEDREPSAALALIGLNLYDVDVPLIELHDVLVDGNRFLDNGRRIALGAAPANYALFALGTDVFTVTNNIIAGSTMGGIAVRYSENMTQTIKTRGVIHNNTLYDNGEHGLWLIGPWSDATLKLTNNAIVSHTVAVDGDGLFAPAELVRIDYALLYANGQEIGPGAASAVTMTHAVRSAPGFVGPVAYNFHLLPNSAARDAGDPAGVPPAPPIDIEGTRRPFGPRVDIGAYEWHGTRIFMPMIKKQSAARVGWAIGQDRGDNAAIVHTGDGGFTWHGQGDPALLAGYDAGDVSAVDAQTAWVALVGNGRGRILHTTDGGATWVSQALPAGLADGIKSVKGLSRDEAWAASLSGTVLHTTDGGASWTAVPHPTAPITQVNRMDAIGSHVWIADAAESGAVVHTSDGGATWRRELLTNDGAADSALTVHAVSPSVVWASGTESLTFYRTLDGGDHWAKAINVGGFDHLDDICASSAEDAWGVTNGGGVDGRIKRVVAPLGGQAQEFDVTPAALRGYMPGGVTCLDNRVAWVVGQQGPNPDPAKPDGVILLTTDGESWTQAVAPSDIHFWKISMVGARR